jgi:CHAT domain-containing protein/tetratricopeptide (TPR) repeat protein
MLGVGGFTAPAVSCESETLTHLSISEADAVDLDIRGGDCRRFSVDSPTPLWIAVNEGEINLTLHVTRGAVSTAYDSGLEGHWLETALAEPGSDGRVRFAIEATGTPQVADKVRLSIERLELVPGKGSAIRHALELTMESLAQVDGTGELTAVTSEHAAAIDEAADVWHRAGHPLEAAWLWLILSRAYQDLGPDYEAALTAVSRGQAGLDPAVYPEQRLRLDMERGALLLFAGKLADAEMAFEDTIARASATASRGLRAELHIYLGLVHHTRDELIEAETNYLRAAGLLSDESIPRLKSMVHNNLAGIYFLRGEPAPAFRHFDEAIAVAAAAGDLEGEAHAQMNAATLHVDIGQFDSALVHYEDAKRVFETLSAEGDVALALRGIGAAYLNLGMPERAIEFLSLAIARAEAVSDLMTVNGARLSLGKAYRMTGEAAAALAVHERLLADTIAQDRTSDTARARVQIALDLVAAGEPSRAGDEIDAAIETLRSIGYRHSLASALYTKGRVESERGRPAAAGLALAEAESLQAAIGDDKSRVLTLTAQARLEARQGHLEKALAVSEQAADLSERIRGQVTNPDLRASLFGTRLDPYDEMVRLHFELAEKGDRHSHVAAALVAAERSRSRTLKARLLAEGPDGRYPDASAGQRELLEKINGRLMRLRSLHRELDRLGAGAGAAGSPDEAQASALRHRIAGLETELRDLRLQLHALDARTGGAGATGRSDTDAAAVGAVTDRLSPGTTVVVYHLTGDEAFAWVISRDGLEGFRLGTTADLVAGIRRAVDMASHWQPDSTGLDEALGYVSRRLVEPIRHRIESDRLVVVPHDAVHSVPFAALPLADGRPLIESLELVYTPSVMSSAGSGDSAWALEDDDSIVVFANPSFDNRSRLHAGVQDSGAIGAILGNLPTLYYSGEEAEAILRLAPGRPVDVYAGTDASKSVLFDIDLARYKIIHFATHAVVIPDFPEYSGVVLAQVDAQGGQTPGLTHLQEIYSLPVDAKLVVLSACSTAEGRTVRGEGPMSIGRAFLFAGAEQVVMTRWVIPDDVAADVMEGFYAGLLRDRLTPAAALRHVQTHAASTSEFEHPFFWAGLFLAGRSGQNSSDGVQR